jgi:hypothetical protein
MLQSEGESDRRTCIMEIKIQCYCGTKYKFDVEPVNGRIPFAVKCPQCGVDASEFANSYVQQSLGIAAPPASIVPALAQATVAAAPLSPATVTAFEPKLRVRREHPTATAAPVASEADAPPPPPPPVAPRPVTRPVTTFATGEDPGMTPRFLLGVLGGVLGAAVGCLIWYLIFHFTGTRLRILAVIVGFTAGLGAKLLSKDEGSSPLGFLTALLTLIGIVVTAYFIGRERAHEFAGGIENTLYKEQVAYAKRAVKAVPNGTDDEIRLFLAKEAADEDEKPQPADVTAAEIQRFRDVDWAHYKELASGQISEADYFKTQRRWLHEEQVAEAKRALATLPDESDAQIRAYLARSSADEGEKPDLKAITAEEIREFRTDVLPGMKALASGQKQFQDNPEDDKKAKEVLEEVEVEAGAWMKFVYFFAGWGMGGVGIMFITLGLAYKICTHA